MVKDKNGIEIKIGDTVHYKRPERSYEMNLINGRTKTVNRPAKDIIFTVDDFVNSPFLKYGGHDPRLRENLIWITGPDLPSSCGYRNSVSPLAVVKIDTMVRRRIPSHSFISPLSGHITP